MLRDQLLNVLRKTQTKQATHLKQFNRPNDCSTKQFIFATSGAKYLGCVKGYPLLSLYQNQQLQQATFVDHF
jgi:hypothetical protein